jgi:hypothetical protein
MSHHDHPDSTDAELRFRLRQLPREIEPGRDLWPGIEARLQPASRRRFPAWTGGLALAASVLAAVVAFQVLRAPAANAPVANAPAPVAAPVAPSESAEAELVQAEARALTIAYEGALAEYAAAPMPDAVKPGLAELDASARDIRLALEASPGSTHLLQMLQRTYARRIELTHRAATA